MLHCLKQSGEGGANEFCDGFHVANQLRDDDPDTFRILSETLVDYVDVGTDAYTFDLAQRKRIIQLVCNLCCVNMFIVLACIYVLVTTSCPVK